MTLREELTAYKAMGREGHEISSDLGHILARHADECACTVKEKELIEVTVKAHGNHDWRPWAEALRSVIAERKAADR